MIVAQTRSEFPKLFCPTRRHLNLSYAVHIAVIAVVHSLAAIIRVQEVCPSNDRT